MNDVFIGLSVALLIVNIPIECLEERVEKIGRLMGVRVVGVTLDQAEDRLIEGGTCSRDEVRRHDADELAGHDPLSSPQNLGKCRWFRVTR